MILQYEGKSYHVYNLRFGCHLDIRETWWLHEREFASEEEMKEVLREGARQYLPEWEEWSRKRLEFTQEKFGIIVTHTLMVVDVKAYMTPTGYVLYDSPKIVVREFDRESCQWNDREVTTPTAREDYERFQREFLDAPDTFDLVMKRMGFISLEESFSYSDVCEHYGSFLPFIASLGMEYHG